MGPEQDRANSCKDRRPELSEDTETCMRALESSLGRPVNPNTTARDLDSMLEDYVDENEDFVALVRSVRDDAD